MGLPCVMKCKSVYFYEIAIIYIIMSDKNMYKPNDICLTLSVRVDREMSTTLSKWAAMYLYYITVQSYSSAEVPVS